MKDPFAISTDSASQKLDQKNATLRGSYSKKHNLLSVLSNKSNKKDLTCHIGACINGDHTLLNSGSDFSAASLRDRFSMNHTIQENIAYLEAIVAQNGPELDNYSAVAEAFSRLHAACYCETDGFSTMTQPLHALESFFDSHAEIFRSVNTMQGFAYAKPRGYAGDFEMIERIYDRVVSDEPHLKRWDEFFHVGAAPNAVRNRAGYIHNVLEKGGYESLLSLGCGSACDLSRTNDEALVKRMTLVDADADAIAKASENLTNPAIDRTFLHKNVFRLKLEERFDIVWSAGLFDYLNTRRAVFLLSRVREAMNDGGRIVIGNFSQENNPSRAYMEIVGEWCLIHRSEAEMASMMIEAGFDPAGVTVDSDDTGVNLFASAIK